MTGADVPGYCRSQRGLVGLAVVLVAGAAGCTNLPPAERASLEQAAIAYRNGDVSGASARADNIIRSYPKAVETGVAYYLRGLCRMKGGQTQSAAQDFEQAIGLSEREDVIAYSRASLAAVAYKQGEWNRAAELYIAAVPKLPDVPPTEQILYFAGVALQRAGKWREATFQFARILRKFRDRPIANDARLLAAWPHDYFSIQLAAFANPQAAGKTMQSFRSKGLDVMQENLPRTGQALWVLMVGRYPTYAEAVAALPALRKVSAGAFIIPQE